MKMLNFFGKSSLILILSSLLLWQLPAHAGPNTVSSQSGAVQTEQVNINTAGAAELQHLPRVGPAISNRIIEYRQKNGAFSKKEDLMKVKGIGPKTFERLASLIKIN